MQQKLRMQIFLQLLAWNFGQILHYLSSYTHHWSWWISGSHGIASPLSIMKFWSDTLWVALRRLWPHWLSCYLRSVVEFLYDLIDMSRGHRSSRSCQIISPFNFLSCCFFAGLPDIVMVPEQVWDWHFCSYQCVCFLFSVCSVFPSLVLSMASWGSVNLAVFSSLWEWRFLYSYERYGFLLIICLTDSW
jgi:hypothetical protein